MKSKPTRIIVGSRADTKETKESPHAPNLWRNMRDWLRSAGKGRLGALEIPADRKRWEGEAADAIRRMVAEGGENDLAATLRDFAAGFAFWEKYEAKTSPRPLSGRESLTELASTVVQEGIAMAELLARAAILRLDEGDAGGAVWLALHAIRRASFSVEEREKELKLRQEQLTNREAELTDCQAEVERCGTQIHQLRLELAALRTSRQKQDRRTRGHRRWCDERRALQDKGVRLCAEYTERHPNATVKQICVYVARRLQVSERTVRRWREWPS